MNSRQVFKWVDGFLAFAFRFAALGVTGLSVYLGVVGGGISRLYEVCFALVFSFGVWEWVKEIKTIVEYLRGVRTMGRPSYDDMMSSEDLLEQYSDDDIEEKQQEEEYE